MKRSIPEKLMKEIEALLPVKKSKKGRPGMCRKQAFEGIVYVLKEGCRWHSLPATFGKPSTVHGIFMRWIKMGFFEQLMTYFTQKYCNKFPENNWYAIDTSAKKAPFAQNWGGKNPTDRAKQGIKHILVTFRDGSPAAVAVAPANVHDSKLLKKIMPSFKPHNHLSILSADSAFDSNQLRQFCKEKSIVLLAAPNPRRASNKNTFSVSHRWVIERTFGWFSWYRSLKICWAKTPSSHLAFLQIASSIQLFKRLAFFV